MPSGHDEAEQDRRALTAAELTPLLSAHDHIDEPVPDLDAYPTSGVASGRSVGRIWLIRHSQRKTTIWDNTIDTIAH